MKFFKKEEKKVEFNEARCPRCGGRLELDSSLEVAYCKDCGCQCIIKNGNKKDKPKFDKVIDYLDRQQELQRQDAQEVKRNEVEMEKSIEEKRLAQREKRSEWWQKNWWKVLLFLLLFMIFTMVCEYLGLLK